jgi:catechol 2,3-dioxygenase-like lactoylglutathione lyase family enzyme
MANSTQPRFQSVCPRLPVADLRRTIHFYTTILGFHLDVLWPEVDPTFCILRRDGVRLAFDLARAPAVSNGRASIGFYIEADNVRTLHESVRQRVPIEWGPEVYSYGRREFAILDPDGYMVIFTEPTDDPLTCPEE